MDASRPNELSQAQGAGPGGPAGETGRTRASKPMPSDGFSGFDEWLDFRVKAALASIEGGGEGRGRKMVRARPLAAASSGDGLWVLSDGESPPVPFLLNAAPGCSGSILGRATDELFEPWIDAQSGREEGSIEQHGDSLVERVAEALKARCGRAGVGPSA